ncbi:MAG TPA: HAD-IA family hydrolase [Chloroflexia bacterium]|nr:HAD-IA family hydrolase [Chloroflexia bacterium]
MGDAPATRAVIFDMDGVIVDSELHWKSLEGFFLQSLVQGWDAEAQSKIIGISVHDLYKMLVEQYGLAKSKDEFLALYYDMAREIYEQRASLLPGFLDLLRALREAGVPLALASSSPMSWIDMVLDRFGLREEFRVAVSADELEGPGKPSPAIYLLTARKLGVPPERCVVIEDSTHGVLSAKRAGMYCIGFQNGFNDEQDLSVADVLVQGFPTLPLSLLLNPHLHPTGHN